MIKYSFHIGERCNSLVHFKDSNLLSSFNCFGGFYVSFNSAIRIIKDNFINFENNIVKFKIAELKNILDVQFIRCHDYNIDELNEIKKLLINNNFYFFYRENTYKNSNYCINLTYTDKSNFLINDMYYYKNNYCAMPNSDYTDDECLNRYYRRKNRFQECLNSENPESILLIYMDKLVIDTDINSKITDVVNQYQLKYQLKYKLFYIIPIYSINEKKLENEKIINIDNITFYTIYFTSLESQIINNPNDDNSLMLHTEEYKKITSTIKECYNFDNLIYFNKDGTRKSFN